jgi:hypothetical protein
MTERHYRSEQPWIDSEGIALVLIVAFLAVVLITAALWIGLR